MERDAEHLKLLSLFHYIRGGLSAFFSCFFLIYFVMGILVFAVPGMSRNNGPPREIGLVFAFIGGLGVTLGWIWAALSIYAGRCLARHKHRGYCMVIAGIGCIFLPYGTLLGVFTLMVLQRESVRQLFDQSRSPMTA